MKSSEEMSIGTVAERFGLATHVLRHWEDTGLLAPRRHANGRRRYGPADEARIAMILLAKDAGLGLDQVRLLFAATADRPTRRALYREHHDRLAERIASLRASLSVLEHAMDCEAEDITACPDFQAKVAARIPG
ncbi:DNA-binding transcriptional MerR regulator [Saccharothrix carnea]|uniref:DNA-binding transcriptional MerR regulator n=1 Tax=Saccharothrix carnea TaxID=1280637 RepID=A0A2P8IG70_SACCR|nr:MerR family transcriptional regulator [Saccharothrix carnea]PSL57459.1 DNA-binding transcriptional MerR regulator [Saccharothrix carnea]